MAQLRTHSLPHLLNVDWRHHSALGSTGIRMPVTPGCMVTHKDDPESLGICVSRRWIWENEPMQCEVVWSKEPAHVMADDVTGRRVLRATWFTESESDFKALHGFNEP